MEADTPRQTFAKQVKTDKDNEQVTLSMVEWMFNDGLDARHDFLQCANLWTFDIIEGPGGKDRAKAGALREECSALPMFSVLPDLERPGKNYEKAMDACKIWLFFNHLFKIHAGEIRLISKGQWKKIVGPIPKGKSYWNCQYAKYDEQRQLAERFGCRAASKNRGVTWAQEPQLQLQQVMAIGSNTMCLIHERL